MFEIWKNELTTPESIKTKLDEIKKQYKKYIKLTQLYNWNKSTIKENINLYKKTIASFEKALQEVKKWKVII